MSRRPGIAVFAAVMAGLAAGLLVALEFVRNDRLVRVELEGAYVVSKDALTRCASVIRCFFFVFAGMLPYAPQIMSLISMSVCAAPWKRQMTWLFAGCLLRTRRGWGRVRQCAEGGCRLVIWPVLRFLQVRRTTSTICHRNMLRRAPTRHASEIPWTSLLCRTSRGYTRFAHLCHWQVV